jgi:ABC-type sugar transport system ATPase subunit
MSLVDSLSVLDNLFLGRELSTRGWVDRRTQVARALALCRELDLDFSVADLAQPVERFPLSVKNRIEIAKALTFEGRVLVMDEPTSALTAPEVDKLFALIERLKGRGCGIIYISHKMEEIYRIADRITVLRDGRRVGTATVAECPQRTLVEWMIGRELSQHFPPRNRPTIARASVLEVKDFGVPNSAPVRPPAVKGISFVLRAGEIVGVAGLQGSGASELLQGLFGAVGASRSGHLRLRGVPFTPANPRASIARGLGYLTGDRKTTGLVAGLSVEENITLAALPKLCPGPWLRAAPQRAAAEEQIAALRIRLASLDQPVATLSGGNQQKVALAKWRETEPTILLLEEPTRGVDVGAKHEIYEMMNAWTADGMAILLLSTELAELIGLCDRILVLHRGELAAELDRREATPDRILEAAMGGGMSGSP